MKKNLAVLLAAMLLCAPACADTITALAIDLNPDDLRLTAAYARVEAVDAGQGFVTVTLIAPEVFSRDEVALLRPGDGIFTGGAEVAIRTVTPQDGYIVLNAGEYEFSDGSVWLSEDMDGNYRPTVYGDFVWNELKTLTLPLLPQLIFLDGIDPATGEARELPAVRSAADFAQIFAREQAGEGPGFAANNVRAVFDRDGQLAVVERYYVPWQ